MLENKTTIVFSGITSEEFKKIKVKWLIAHKNLSNYDLKLVKPFELSEYIYKNFLNYPKKVIVVSDLNIDRFENLSPEKLKQNLVKIKNRFQQFNANDIKTIVYSDKKIPQLFEGLPIIKKNEILKLYDVISKYKSVKIKPLNNENLLKYLLNTKNYKYVFSEDGLKHILSGFDRSILDLTHKKKLSKKEKIELFLLLQKKQLDKELKIAYKNGNYSKKQINELFDKYQKITKQYYAMDHGSKSDIKKVIDYFYSKKEKTLNKSTHMKIIHKKLK